MFRVRLPKDLATRRMQHWGKCIPVEHNHNRDYSTSWYDVAPKADDDVAGDDFKRYKRSFEDEEIPSGCYAEGIVNVASCEANEGGGNGEVGHHLSNTWFPYQYNVVMWMNRE
jgi:hypothetical protein